MLSSARKKRVPCPSRVLCEKVRAFRTFRCPQDSGSHGVFIRHNESSHKKVIWGSLGTVRESHSRDLGRDELTFFYVDFMPENR